MIISLAAAEATGPAEAGCGYYPEMDWLKPVGTGSRHPLLCLAPRGVFRAPELAPRAVGFYPAFSPLPDAETPGGLFSVTLSVTSSLGRKRPRILRGTMPGGVRTFLSAR